MVDLGGTKVSDDSSNIVSFANVHAVEQDATIGLRKLVTRCQNCDLRPFSVQEPDEVCTNKTGSARDECSSQGDVFWLS